MTITGHCSLVTVHCSLVTLLHHTIKQLYRQRYAFLRVLWDIVVIGMQRYYKNRFDTIPVHRLSGSTSILRVEM